MANFSEIYIKKETLQQLLNNVGSEKGIKVTIAQSDESDKYGQNVSAYISQSKEQREAKEKKTYIGNGKVFWTKGETPVGVKPATDELPR